MAVAENLQLVKALITNACSECERDPQTVQLVAVSKVHPKDHVRTALVAGHRRFGENRVQEALEKWPGLKAEFPDTCLHLIGSLQTNKVKEAVGLFDVIETLDREKLARRIQKECQEQNRDVGCYIQINTGEESQKGGCLPSKADEFISYCRHDLGLKILGLMCIPPIDEEPSLHFAFLRELARRHDLAGLSMGMSGDFETAVRFGATSVRVGTAIFGARP